MQMQTLCCTLD